jgi:hypothetical protein
VLPALRVLLGREPSWAHDQAAPEARAAQPDKVHTALQNCRAPRLHWVTLPPGKKRVCFAEHDDIQATFSKAAIGNRHPAIALGTLRNNALCVHHNRRFRNDFCLMFPFCCESLDIGYVYAHLLREWAAEQYERFSLQLHVVAGMRTQQLA